MVVAVAEDSEGTRAAVPRVALVVARAAVEARVAAAKGRLASNDRLTIRRLRGGRMGPGERLSVEVL